MRALILLLAMIGLAGCDTGGGGGGSSSGGSTPEIATPVAPVTQPVDPVEDPVITPAGPTTVSVTYYSMSSTIAPMQGWSTKTYTATGHCVSYLSKKYCWDDGIKTLAWVDGSNNHYGPFTYTYWDVMVGQSGGPLDCDGGCGVDYMSDPTQVEIAHSALSAMVLNSEVEAVLNNGAPTTVSCTDDGTTLDCGSFTITL